MSRYIVRALFDDIEQQMQVRDHSVTITAHEDAREFDTGIVKQSWTPDYARRM